MREPATWDVYLVTDRALSKGRSTLEIVEAAVRGGISAVQLREKGLETGAFYEEGLEIRGLLRSAGVPLIINDRIDVALALDADGVHLGQSDIPVSVARSLLGPRRIIGLSVEDPSHISQDAVSYADYLGISPIFLTGTKAELIRMWGLDGLRHARTLTTLPLVGIGSIKRDNARSVIEAGADCVAVVTAIVAEDDPELATRYLAQEAREGKRSKPRGLRGR
jgi:thiamine-phosphate pyrophosphorylase